MLRLAIPLLCCLLPVVIQLDGQDQTAISQNGAGAANLHAYDVVSIRQVKDEPESAGYGDLADGFQLRGLTLKSPIPDAYGVRNDAVSGWPGWADSVRFDIEARMDPETADALHKLPKQQQDVQRQLMLRSLLADRFRLKVHRSTEVRNAYELALAKNGPRMNEDNPSQDMGGNLWQDGVRPSTDWSTSDRKISGHAMPLSILVNGLQGAVGAIIVDKTGLTGRFDVVLHWNPVDRQAPDSTEPSLFTALGEQLGLRLKPTKTTVNTIVIDRLEMPSPN
jgi:uncharacterized protein (TIGR03435 family)